MSTPEYYEKVANAIMIDGIHTSYVAGSPRSGEMLSWWIPKASSTVLQIRAQTARQPRESQLLGASHDFVEVNDAF
ncbi:MAG: hypothetical protein WAM39_18935 [Bryobacteraceae bacterium]